MSQHGYMLHTATPPLVLDLIRLIQLGSCGSINNFYLLTATAVLAIRNETLQLQRRMGCLCHGVVPV